MPRNLRILSIGIAIFAVCTIGYASSASPPFERPSYAQYIDVSVAELSTTHLDVQVSETNYQIPQSTAVTEVIAITNPQSFEKIFGAGYISKTYDGYSLNKNINKSCELNITSQTLHNRAGTNYYRCDKNTK